jgi:hypothetical protein
MSNYITSNIVRLFRMDTLLASTSGIVLETYMMRKHGWDISQYKEYFEIYLSNFTRRDEWERAEIMAEQFNDWLLSSPET